MRFRVIIVLFFALVGSCVAKDSTTAGIKDDLKNAMRTYLYGQISNDSSNIKYIIEDVVYYDDDIKHRYICEFKVNLKAKLFDTTGIMKADVSKDFKKVTRY
jgi:hypothetical protein